jgi:hypothetical protein
MGLPCAGATIHAIGKIINYPGIPRPPIPKSSMGISLFCSISTTGPESHFFNTRFAGTHRSCRHLLSAYPDQPGGRPEHPLDIKGRQCYGSMDSIAECWNIYWSCIEFQSLSDFITNRADPSANGFHAGIYKAE